MPTSAPVPATVRIEPMTSGHADQVLAIYQAGIDTRVATFETSVPDWPSFDAAHLPAHRFVALDADGGSRVLGWVAVSAASQRSAYAGVVEHSVYVDAAASRRGIGRALLDAVIASTEAAGIWTVRSGVFPQNTASLRLHEAAGFRTVGVRERVGRLDGQWRDVILVERRSPIID